MITYYVNSGLTYEIDCMYDGIMNFGEECNAEDFFYMETQLTFITGMENPVYEEDLAMHLGDSD